MNTILCPLDGSLRAEQALPHALAQVRPSQDRLVLVRVVEPYPVSHPPHVTQQYNELLVDDSKQYLQELGGRLRAQGWRVEELVRWGQAAHEVAHAAGEVNASLIVASSHGRTGASRWLLGSVAENIARRAPCPVWLIRSHSPRPEEVAITAAADLPERPRVMVPLDGSRHSEQGLQWVRHHLASQQARVLLVGATDLPGRAIRGREEVTNLLESYLTGQVALLREKRWTAEHAVVDGPAAASILDLAAERKPDLIVMASQGRTGLGRWVVGSVAERVLRHANCPVVLVPQVKSEEVSQREYDYAR